MKKMTRFAIGLIVFLFIGTAVMPLGGAAEGDPFDFTVPEAYTVEVGSTVQIVPEPAQSASGPIYSYSMLDGTQYARVNVDGLVTGLSVGTARVWVTGAMNGEVLGKAVTITVSEAQAPFTFEVMNSGASIEVGDTHTVIVVPPAGNGITYTYSMLGGEKYARVDAAGVVTGISEGTGYIWVTGTKGEEKAEQSVTVKVTKKTQTTSKRLVISTSTNLDKKVGDASFTMSVSFNTTKSNVDYVFEIDDENVATIDENSGLIRIKRAGTATITVSASADGFESATKDFTLYVSSASGSSTSSSTS
ncbi:MAG: Ig-like domain-containing protein [Oscillospiraceae bacterium]|jgi:uncharacterized protein YjdB|nr:Ig-like domain-containing protein [Oscillospiraceae bacterium]